MPARVSYKFGDITVPFLEVKPGEIKDINPWPHVYLKVFCSPEDQATAVGFYDKVRVPTPKTWPRLLRFLEPQKYGDGLRFSDIRVVENQPLSNLGYPIVVEHVPFLEA